MQYFNLISVEGDLVYVYSEKRVPGWCCELTEISWIMFPESRDEFQKFLPLSSVSLALQSCARQDFSLVHTLKSIDHVLEFVELLLGHA